MLQRSTNEVEVKSKEEFEFAVEDLYDSASV